tara:strand:- start:241 stop:1464 length:1224 start_codon:yes stop_codon:yes gene_type:complete
MKKSIFLLTIIAIFTISCEDNEAGATDVAFDITKIDVKSTGDSEVSQPELVRFVSSTEGVIVNSKTNSLDFFGISGTALTMGTASVTLTDDPDGEASSIDVSVDNSIVAGVVTRGACTRGELYLVEAATKTKHGPYQLGFNPDAVDISVDNQYVVVVNEYDYGDGVDGGCDSIAGPGVTIYDISNGLGNATLVKDMVINHRGSNGDLAEPEGVKIAPDGRTVFMTLQESNEIGWFDILNPPDTLIYRMEFTSANHKPDGIWVNDEQTYVATAGEVDGQLCVTMLDGPNGAPSTQTYANLASDLPSNWTWEDITKGIEPEEILIVDKDNQSFMISTLQDAGAVVVYNITDPLNPVYDSGAITELDDYTQEEGGMSSGEPEGLHYKNGFVLVANTGDPSVALFKASWVD